MCKGEPRAMAMDVRGKGDPPIFTIKICVPRHGYFRYCKNHQVFIVAVFFSVR